MRSLHEVCLRELVEREARVAPLDSRCGRQRSEPRWSTRRRAERNADCVIASDHGPQRVRLPGTAAFTSCQSPGEQ